MVCARLAPGGLGATKQLTHPPPVTASKPVKAYVQPVGPHLIWLKRNRLEYFDEARIGSPWNKPSAHCIAEVSPRVRGGLHIDRKNVEVTESVWPSRFITRERVLLWILCCLFFPDRVFCTSTT